MIPHGRTAPHRRAVLASGLASGLVSGLVSGLACAMLPAAGSRAQAEPGAPSLAALAAKKGILFGMAVTAEQVGLMPPLAAIAVREAALLVPGVELKWSEVEPEPGRFAFADADRLAELGRRHGLALRGHTLLWHEALPAWVAATNRDAMPAVLRRHIREICRHYAGRVQSWDVVNEAIQPGPDRSDGLRRTPFLETLGDSYIERAFDLAAETDPAAILTLNEYDLERDTPWQAQRRQAMLNLLNRLVRRKVPVRALGIQGHLDARRGPLDPEIFRRFIRDVASLGLEVYITELDVIDRDLPADIARRDAEAARAAQAYLTAALAEPAVRMVVTWGVSDARNWVDGNPDMRRTDGLPSRPHLYDDAFRPKPLRAAVADAFRAAPVRPAP